MMAKLLDSIKKKQELEKEEIAKKLQDTKVLER